MPEIRKAREEDIPRVSDILIPAFKDKVISVIGDKKKAKKIIPTIIRSMKGQIFVYETQMENQLEKNFLKQDGEKGKAPENFPCTDDDFPEEKREIREKSEIVGAIIISVSKFKISFPVLLKVLSTQGIVGSVRAFRKVNNYLKSVPGSKKREGKLEAVGVLEEFRGTGIGEKLVIQGENYLKGKNIRYYGLGVKEDNPAVKLYEKLGFEIKGNYHNQLGNWNYMVKDLEAKKEKNGNGKNLNGKNGD